MRKIICACAACLIVGCAKPPPTPNCVVTITDKKDFLKSEEKTVNCACTCPPQSKSTVVDGLGVLGGIANLWSSND